ncbi:MAG: phosphotransferase family protein [Sulfurovum sp.]|nr:phosphotransferase family protein [Sulfurovum sp.]
MKKDLSDYPPFGEVTLKPLPHQGYSNTNYSFEYNGKTYLFRWFGLTDRNREAEFHIQQSAHCAGIAPKPYVLGKDFMISAFVEGEHQCTLGAEELKRLAGVLRMIHALPLEGVPVIDSPKRIKQHTQAVKQALECIANYPKEVVLCHNDLNPRNLIWQEDTLMVIDWEFAGMNDRYFDLAAVCVEFRLNEEMQRVLLEVYFEGKDFSLEKLKAYKVIYKQLCDEWFNNL